ncbi:MAG: C45 family autoproteolytic acyltransferase/hydrolase [Chthonomonadales bacterium]
MDAVLRRTVTAMALAAWAGVCALPAWAVDVSRYGKRMEVGAGDAKVIVLLLRGSPYHMGYAEGKLCAREIRYMVQEVAPKMMAGMKVSPQRVDEIWKLYAKHLRKDYLEELRGEADGSGVPLREIQRLEAIPDISEWHCSFFAAYGPATKGGELVQIRALDYTTDAGIQKYPALKIYMPERGVPFVNVGWAGICGLVSGMNRNGIAMSEIGDDWDMKTDTFDGRPLTYVMRDAVQFGRTLDEAVRLVRDGPRTTSLLYCLSSANPPAVRALKTSHAHCIVYTPSTLPFPHITDTVYMSMGMDSPWNLKLSKALKAVAGKVDVRIAQQMMHTLKTGSLHAVVFKPGTGDLWVANATDKEPAYNRPFVHFNLKQAIASSFFAAHTAKGRLKAPRVAAQ